MKQIMQRKPVDRMKKMFLCGAMVGVMSLSALALPVLASGSPFIDIEKPEGWGQSYVTLQVSVDGSEMGDGFTVSRVEAKIGEQGSWNDITDAMNVTVTENVTVYVRVTDADGNVYEQNRSVKCFDEEKPTLAASLTDGVLSIQAYDMVSGIAAVTVNGTEYTDLSDGTLKIQLTQENLTTKKIVLTATDVAGNTSDNYSLQNPYYEWAVQQLGVPGKEENNMSTTTSTDSSTGTGEVQAPLPQNAGATEPTEATATVIDRTVTGVVESTGEDVEQVSQTVVEESKVFYTITTKSGKVFYLIVDNSMESDNVFLLTEVSEQDLMNFTLSDTVTLPGTGTVYAERETEVTVAEPEIPEETEAPEVEEPMMPEDTNPIGAYALIALAALGVLGAGIYFKVIRPKQDYDDDEYDEYEETPVQEPVEQDEADQDEAGADFEEEFPEIPEEEEYEEEEEK